MTESFAYVHPSELVRFTGDERVDLLHRLSSNDLKPLAESGKVTSTLFTTNQGKLIDWTWLVSRAEELLVVTSSGRGQKLVDWVEQFTIMEDVEGSTMGTLAVIQIAGAAAGTLGVIPADDSTTVEHEGGTWFRGSPGFGDSVLGIVGRDAVEGWLEKAHSAGATTLDDESYEQKRLLAGVPSPTKEFPEEVNPLELRLTDIAVSFHKGCYVGQEVISRLDSYSKVARHMVGLEVSETVAFSPELRLRRNDKPIGRVTSLEGNLGLGIVKTEETEPGPVTLMTPDGAVDATIVDRPFWKAP